MKKILIALCSVCIVILIFGIVINADNGNSVKGDANGDGVVDTQDVILIRKYLANLDYNTGVSSVEVSAGADVDGNGEIRLNDLCVLRDYIVNGDWGSENLPEVKYSEGLKFVSNGDNTCYVSGIGSCTDSSLIIPPVSPSGDKVTSIATYAFYNCENITSVTIPDSVTSIGEYAFAYCVNIADINFGNGVTKIRFGAFYGCSSVESLIIPDSVKEVGEGAFAYCSKLKNVVISDNITEISNSMFYYCESLESVTIPENVTSIGDYAFEAFDALMNVTFFDNVKNIGYAAFNECDRIENVYFAGSSQEWSAITIGYNNTDLCDANIVFDYISE